MAAKNFIGDTEFASDNSNFIFEEFAQRLDKFEVHLLREAADIVMTLDSHRRAADGNRFDDVRVESSLHQELYVADLTCLFVKDVDESCADDLSFSFRVDDTAQSAQEPLTSINTDDV